MLLPLQNVGAVKIYHSKKLSIYKIFYFTINIMIYCKISEMKAAETADHNNNKEVVFPSTEVNSI